MSEMFHEFQVDIVRTSQLDAAQHTAVVQLCTAAFAQDFGTIFNLVPSNAAHVLVWRAGTLVGHATWMTRWLEPQGQPPLRTAYVDAVATAPAYQRHGIGSLVMGQLAAHIQDYDVGALSTARVNFYRRLGWECWQGSLGVRTPQGIQFIPEELVMILRLPRTPLDLDVTLPLSVDWRAGSVW